MSTPSELWPALAVISPEFAADEQVTLEGDEIMISVANGVALYRKSAKRAPVIGNRLSEDMMKHDATNHGRDDVRRRRCHS